MRAYALMRNSSELEASYLASPLVERNRTALDLMRRALAFNRFSYRGIGRCPLSEDYPETVPGWQGVPADR